jgi:uncharacterized membrane protein
MWPPTAPAEASPTTLWRALWWALAVMGYALISHLLMVRAANSPWAVAVLLGPLVVTLGAVALARRHGVGIGLAVACLIGLAVVMSRGGVADLHRLYVLQHAGVHAALGAVVAMSLRRGAVPMITGVALRVHRGVLSPAMVVYSRRVTQLWLLYFGGMALLSLGLFAFAPWALWSAVANFATPLTIAALLVGERWWRYRLHPEFERASIMAAVQAYRSPRAPTS